MLNVNHIKELLRPYRIVILVFILIAFFLRIPLLQIRYYDPDEFQHLHGARQIYHGEIPYRDYFDHHTPFLHFVMSLFYPIIGDSTIILNVARCLMLLFTAIILYLTFILAKRIYSTDVGLLATLFLSYILIFLEKTLEVRPDLGSVTFWLASIFFMAKGIQEKGKPRSFLFSGISMGVALMFTQKSMFGLPGIFIALMYPFIDRRIGVFWKQNIKLILSFALGISIPIALTCLFFLVHGALWQFIYCNFIMNSQWKVRFSPKGYINQVVNQNPFLPVMGLAGLLVSIVLMFKKEEASKGIYIPVFCTLSVIVGLFIMPVPYRQYYQLFLPLLAIYSAFILDNIMKIKINKNRIFALILTILIILLIIGGLIYTLKMSKPSMNNLNNLLKFIHLKPMILYIILGTALTISAIIMLIFRKRNYAIMLVAVAIVIYPLDQMINQFSQRNDGQIAYIQYILDNTTPSEAVLDGWSGYGFLRPHAYYYYFLHGEMRAMLNEKQLTDDLIKSVEERNTKIIIFDGDMRTLPQKTQDYITTNYVHTQMGDLYIRK